MILKKSRLLLLSLVLLLTAGCGGSHESKNKPASIAIPESKLDLKFTRFEQEIFDRKTPFDSVAIQQLRSKYGNFFDLWCFRLAYLVSPLEKHPSDTYLAYNLTQYTSDKYIREVYDESQKQFSDVNWISKDMTEAFKRYSVLFPGKTIPKLITYTSPFTSNVMAMDSTLGLGLHFYFGADYKYYPTLNLPHYMMVKFRKEYIVRDLLQGWLDSEFTNDTIHNSFMNQIVYNGKILYALDLLTDHVPDSVKIGYSDAQYKWAIDNETKVWAFFIEQQLLYSTNTKLYMKYVNDGNSTNGFPKEAPAKLGVFIGWQIVRAYMKNHPDVSLSKLFQNQDAQFILANSGYKPAKK